MKLVIKLYILYSIIYFTSFTFSADDIAITKNTSTIPSFSLKKTPNKGIDIQKVMDYPIPDIIARYRKDYKVSQDLAKIHEIELKRYLILVADTLDDEDGLSMLSTQVDNLWHTFLLFTKEYQAFCNDMFGKFIHHVPRVDKKS